MHFVFFVVLVLVMFVPVWWADCASVVLLY